MATLYYWVIDTTLGIRLNHIANQADTLANIGKAFGGKAFWRVPPNTRWTKHLGFACVLLLMMTVTACKSIPTHKPIAPKVSIASVRPLNLSLQGQKINFKLRVANPNAYDLPLRNLDFVASFAGEEIAKGLTNQSVTIPANGEAMVDIEVLAGLGKLLGQIRSMAKSKELNLNYGVKGSVKLDNWPSRIPFDVEGELEEPEIK